VLLLTYVNLNNTHELHFDDEPYYSGARLLTVLLRALARTLADKGVRHTDTAHLSVLESLLCAIGAWLEQGANMIPVGMCEQDTRYVARFHAHELQLVEQHAPRISKNRYVALPGVDENFFFAKL
jgi:hypothetical protein